jgi:hypothetical protein
MKLGDFVSSPCIEVPEEWRRIEETLGLTEPNNEVRKSIARYVDHHLFVAELALPNPRNKAKREWITKIRTAAESLTQNLDWKAVDDESDDAWAQMYMVHELLPPDEQRRLLPILKKLISDADKTLAEIPPDKGGRSPNLFYRDLILDLAFVYEWATGQRPTCSYNDYGDGSCHFGVDGNVAIYEGAFLDFVATVLRVFAPAPAKKNMALGKQVQRVLEVWRRLRGFKDRT